jgi:hypothetical protein
MRLKKTSIVTALAAAAILPAHAQKFDCDKSFGFRADVNGVAGQTICASNVDSFIEAAKNFRSSNGYSHISSAQAVGRFNDMNVTLSYTAQSAALNYNFPELGMSGTVTGNTREESEQQLVDILKKENVLGKALRYQSEHSAASALTGAGSLIQMLGGLDFATGFDPASKIGAGTPDVGAPNNLIGAALGYASYTVDGSGEQVKTSTLPLSYTIRGGDDGRRQIVLSMPVMQATIGDARSYNAGLGVAVRLPVSENWTITPGVRYSAVGSLDRATVSTVASGSLMSTYVIPMHRFDLAVGNMIALYKTGKFSNGDYTLDPDIKLNMTRNGLMATMPTTLFGANTAAEFSLIDTRYLGDKPYVSESQEIGFSMGTNRNASSRSFVRAGVSYVRSNVMHGFTANVGYWF